MSDREPVWIDFDRVVAETELALRYDQGDKQHWVPKSQILDKEEKRVLIPYWLAFKLGLI